MLLRELSICLKAQIPTTQLAKVDLEKNRIKGLLKRET